MTDVIAPYIPFAIVDAQGKPTASFQVWWNASLAKAVAAAVAAQAAADAAATAQSTAVTAIGDAAAADANANTRQIASTSLTALSALSSTGLVEQTGPGAFTDRAIGVAAGTSIPTTADADGRYVQRNQTAAPVYSAYAGQTMGAAYSQAQAQATDDALKALSAAVVSLNSKLQAIHAFT